MDWLDYREKLGIGYFDDDKRKYFMVKIFNILDGLRQEGSEGFTFKEYFAFCDKTGTTMNPHITQDNDSSERYAFCVDVLKRHRADLREFLSYYVAFFNSISVKDDNGKKRKSYVDLITGMMDDAHIPFELLEDNGNIFIFPKGASELDSALVSQPLEWLNGYPAAHTAWVKALKEYASLTEDNISEVADKFRKALETFMQEFFSCDKSLENCKALYGGYLKAQGVPKELVSNFEALLQMYTTFMNAYAKHHDRTERNTLEYIMYQTGNTIRLLITLKQSESL